MRWRAWLVSVAALLASARAQSAEPSLCEERACRCDAFTRVICNCTAEHDDVMLRPQGVYRVPSMTTGIIVDGCARVHFLTETVRNLRMLREVYLNNIGSVLINEKALAWTPFTDLENHQGINININNSTITEISSNAIQGRVNRITIKNCKVTSLKAFAFSSLIGVTNIELIDNEFEQIEIQAFKKFTTISFLLQGGTINFLPSRFLSDVEVTDLFRMDRVNVHHISSVSFLINLPQRVLVENNDIGILGGDGFSIVTRGPVTLRNNTILRLEKGGLFGFSVNPAVVSIKGRQELLFDNNTVNELTPSSFMYNTSTMTMRIDGLNLNLTCSCELAAEWQELQKQHGGVVNCWYPLEGYFVSVPTYIDMRCGSFKQTFWIYVVIGIVIVGICALLVVWWIVKHENDKKKKVQMVMPDGKTYRETEFHIVVERAELLTTDL